jgi:hypothetical protein
MNDLTWESAVQKLCRKYFVKADIAFIESTLLIEGHLKSAYKDKRLLTMIHDPQIGLQISNLESCSSDDAGLDLIHTSQVGLDLFQTPLILQEEVGYKKCFAQLCSEEGYDANFSLKDNKDFDALNLLSNFICPFKLRCQFGKRLYKGNHTYIEYKNQTLTMGDRTVQDIMVADDYKRMSIFGHDLFLVEDLGNWLLHKAEPLKAFNPFLKADFK